MFCKNLMILDLLDGREVEGERDFALASISLEFVPDDEIAFVVEDEEVRK